MISKQETSVNLQLITTNSHYAVDTPPHSARSKGYVHRTAVPPTAEPARRSIRGPVPKAE